MAHFVGYGYESNECADESLTGDCNGFVPANEWRAGDECACRCHNDYAEFDSGEEVAQWHDDKHASAQDGAYHNIGFSHG